MDGILRCTRYAFGPNRLHYCGPDVNSEIGAYLEHGSSDPGLEHLLKQFQNMYPYLKHIASANHIRDHFDDRVVEAYWIGNALLENTEKRTLYNHFVNDRKITKKMGKKDFSHITGKIASGAVPHHSFHVFDVWKRANTLGLENTLEVIDECRISWGKVTKIDGPYVYAEIESLAYRDGKLFLDKPIVKKLARRLESEYDIEQMKAGDLITIHWSVPCEVISQKQLAMLKHYTLKHLVLANQTL